jgi:hypothetical protein
MTTAYSREAEGLQAVERYDYPEVVPQHSPLEVASPHHDVSSKRDAYGPEDVAAGQAGNHSDAWPQSHETKGMISSAGDATNEKGYISDTAKNRMRAAKTSCLALGGIACRCGTGSCSWWSSWNSRFEVKHRVIAPYPLLNRP